MTLLLGLALAGLRWHLQLLPARLSYWVTTGAGAGNPVDTSSCPPQVRVELTHLLTRDLERDPPVTDRTGRLRR